MSAADRLTPTELRLAEQYVRVLDFVSRCAQAVDRGDWFYLYDKAGQLEDAAGRLARIAGETWQEISAGTPRPRKAAVGAAVAHYGRHYRAARLLHPTRPPEGVGRHETPTARPAGGPRPRPVPNPVPGALPPARMRLAEPLVHTAATGTGQLRRPPAPRAPTPRGPLGWCGRMSFGPITDREQLGWQRRTVRVLAGLLEQAGRDGLPPVAWQVSDAGAVLVARCFAHDPGRRRADFDAWCQALDTHRWPERTSGATTHLHAVAKDYDGLVDVAVLADLFAKDEPQ